MLGPDDAGDGDAEVWQPVTTMATTATTARERFI
jgi:hypothetical protein